jgi:hypothetical protein
MQARAVARHFPAEAIAFWQDAVDRAGRQWSEVLRRGVRETARVRGARVLWGQFAEARPHIALAYAEIVMDELRVPETDVRGFFDIWWEHCAAGPVTNEDATIYYRYAPRWSSAVQLEKWMKDHRKRLAGDFRTWVTLLHGWKQDARAWEVYRVAVPEPPRTAPPKGATRKSLEDSLRVSPDNANIALELAHYLEQEGDLAGSSRVLMEAARQANAAPRVLREAAYRLAAEKRFAEAVEMALREKPEPKR